MKIGLMISRMQPGHTFHYKLIDKINSECDVTIVVNGSSSIIDDKNILTNKERREQVYNIYGSSVHQVFINDIGTDSSYLWLKYVMINIEKQIPTINFDHHPIRYYYCGSLEDSKWYTDYFGIPKIESFYTNVRIEEKRLIVCDREAFGNNVSATMIRESIKNNDNMWKKYIPHVNHYLIDRLTSIDRI